MRWWAVGTFGLLALAGLPHVAQAESASGKLVAVLPLSAPKLDNDLKETLEEDIRTVTGSYLSPLGYTILTGDNTLEVLADNGIDGAKACDATCALQAARELKANLFISGSATKAEGEYVAFVRLFEAKSGRQIDAVKLEGAKVKDLRDQFEAKAATLFRRITGDAPAEAPEATAVPDVESSGPRVKKGRATAAVGTLTIVTKPKEGVRLDLEDPDGKKSTSGGSYENKAAKPGTWKVKARASGYDEQTQEVEVPADDVALLRIELKKLGGLKIVGTPAGAAVSVSGPDGFHDDGGLPWEAAGLKSGSYRVKVTRTGYGPDEETVEVAPGETATARVALQKGGETKVEPKSGLTFVRLPGGTFHFGCEPQDTDCFDDEKPGRSATVQSFWLGKTTVTVAAYAKCVSAGACTTPDSAAGHSDDWSTACTWGVSGKENHPINCVDWNQATAFCQWIGGRLPSAEEWEYAAKGGESQTYPWGNAAVNGKLANYCDTNCPSALPSSARKQWEDNKWIDYSQNDSWAGTSPMGSYSAGATKHGLLDMAGNAWQWTASNYDASNKEARGGSWGSVPRYLRASNRAGWPAGRYGVIGFRCVL